MITDQLIELRNLQIIAFKYETSSCVFQNKKYNEILLSFMTFVGSAFEDLLRAIANWRNGDPTRKLPLVCLDRRSREDCRGLPEVSEHRINPTGCECVVFSCVNVVIEGLCFRPRNNSG